MLDIIETKISHLRQPFVIKEDGTSQTQLSNTGRVGFHVERAFDIWANNDRAPDLGDWELKTIQRGKKVSIGTMPESEFRAICKGSNNFVDSDPYKKMKNTVFVVYEKLRNYPEPEYIVRGWGACKLNSMNDYVKKTLQEDYEYICKVIKKQATSRDDLTNYLMNYGSISGNFLSLAYKGAGIGGYNYPAWGFQASFMNRISHA
jgi:hypothetical protein